MAKESIRNILGYGVDIVKIKNPQLKVIIQQRLDNGFLFRRGKKKYNEWHRYKSEKEYLDHSKYNEDYKDYKVRYKDHSYCNDFSYGGDGGF